MNLGGSRLTRGELLLDVQNLSTHFKTEEGILRAVDRVSFQVHRGETLGIVGESGCGKSVTAKSIMQIVPKPKGSIVGKDLVSQGRRDYRYCNPSLSCQQMRVAGQ